MSYVVFTFNLTFVQFCGAKCMEVINSSVCLNLWNAKLFRQFDSSNTFQGINCKIWTKTLFRAVMGSRNFLIRIVCFVFTSCFSGCCEFYVCFCVLQLIIVLCVVWPFFRWCCFPVALNWLFHVNVYHFQLVMMPPVWEAVGTSRWCSFCYNKTLGSFVARTKQATHCGKQ